MAFFPASSDDEGSDQHDMGAMFGPGHVDQTIRQAIQVCWMALPKEKRTVDEVERQIRRLVDRAIKDFREDGEMFGRDTDG
jgi:hypothetical protein